MLHDNKRLEHLVEMAQSDADIESMGLSDKEEIRVRALRTAIRGLQIPMFSAPSASIQAAKALFEAPDREVRYAKLASTNFQLAGARSGDVDSFAATYESGDLTLRINMSRQEFGWMLLARSSEPGWEMVLDGNVLASDELGRFEIEHLSELPKHVVLTKGIVDVYLPLAEEYSDGNGGRSDSSD